MHFHWHDEIIPDASKFCDEFNDYLVNIGSKHASNIHSSTYFDYYFENPLIIIKPTFSDKIRGILIVLTDGSNGH